MAIIIQKFILTVLLVSLITGSSGSGDLIWVKSAGGTSGFIMCNGITALSDNSTVVTGAFLGSVTFGSGEPNQTTLVPTGYEDIFIARYNPDGKLAWAKHSGGADEYSTVQGNGITTLSDNSTVVTGHFTSSTTFGQDELNQTVLISSGGDDFFIARYNQDGSLAWAKSAEGASGIDYGLRITTLSDNSIVVTGVFYGSATFGLGEPNHTNLTSAGYTDIFIALYNPDGTLEWVKRAGGADYEASNGITTLSDNSTVVTGVYYDSITFGPGEPNQVTLASAGESDFFIARYNPDGTLAWAKSAGGASFDQGKGITTSSDNSTVVTGAFYDSITFGPGEPNQVTLTSAGESDFFIACYNPDGTLTWAKSAGGVSIDVGSGITTLSDNSTVMTGWFSKSATFGSGEANEIVLNSTGFMDIFIAHYNPDGTLAWAKRTGGTNIGTGSGITALSDNSTVVIGRFQGSATFGPGEANETVLNSAGLTDLFIARFNP